MGFKRFVFLSGLEGRYRPLSEFVGSDVFNFREFLCRIDDLDLPLSESEFIDSFIRTRDFKGFLSGLDGTDPPTLGFVDSF